VQRTLAGRPGRGSRNLACADRLSAKRSCLRHPCVSSPLRRAAFSLRSPSPSSGSRIQSFRGDNRPARLILRQDSRGFGRSKRPTRFLQEGSAGARLDEGLGRRRVVQSSFGKTGAASASARPKYQRIRPGYSTTRSVSFRSEAIPRAFAFSPSPKRRRCQRKARRAIWERMRGVGQESCTSQAKHRTRCSKPPGPSNASSSPAVSVDRETVTIMTRRGRWRFTSFPTRRCCK